MYLDTNPDIISSHRDDKYVMLNVIIARLIYCILCVVLILATRVSRWILWHLSLITRFVSWFHHYRTRLLLLTWCQRIYWSNVRTSCLRSSFAWRIYHFRQEYFLPASGLHRLLRFWRNKGSALMILRTYLQKKLTTRAKLFWTICRRWMFRLDVPIKSELQ